MCSGPATKMGTQAEAGYDIVGVDISRAMVELAKKNAPRPRGRIGRRHVVGVEGIPQIKDARPLLQQ